MALLASASPSYAGGIMMMGGGVPVSGPSYLLSENFTTGSAPSGWTTVTGAVYNYTAGDAAPMEGDYSFAVDASLNAGSITVYSNTFTASSDVYVACKFYYSTASPGDNIVALGFSDASNNWLACIYQDTANNLDGATTGGTSVNNFYALTIDTPIYIKMRYRKGTAEPATSAIVDFWTSANGKTWTSEGSITNGTSTADVVKLVFRASSSCNGQRVYDQVRVSTSDINY